MKLTEYLNTLKINSEMSETLASLFAVRECAAGDIIQDISHNSGKICLILKGIVRGYYISEDGSDITKCFSSEGNWCCFYNYLSNEPPAFYVEALEPCVLAEIETDKFRKVLEKHSKLRNLYDKLYTDAFMKTDERGAAFQKMSAKQRYLKFIESSPDIVKRVKQEYIASYLGITPSSLSRIKKEL